MHEVRRQLHNEKILRDLEDSKVELTQKKAELEANIADLSNPIDPSPKRKS
jgi:hypothetical protein